MDSLRKTSRLRRRETAFTDDLLLIAGDADEPATEAEAGSVSDLLSHLPRREAEALRLTKVEGLSLAEASSRSGHSIGALKVAVHRAIDRLKRRSSGRQE